MRPNNNHNTNAAARLLTLAAAGLLLLAQGGLAFLVQAPADASPLRSSLGLSASSRVAAAPSGVVRGRGRVQVRGIGFALCGGVRWGRRSLLGKRERECKGAPDMDNRSTHDRASNETHTDDGGGQAHGRAEPLHPERRGQVRSGVRLSVGGASKGDGSIHRSIDPSPARLIYLYVCTPTQPTQHDDDHDSICYDIFHGTRKPAVMYLPCLFYPKNNAKVGGCGWMCGCLWGVEGW